MYVCPSNLVLLTSDAVYKLPMGNSHAIVYCSENINSN